jgi:hypothetical protein
MAGRGMGSFSLSFLYLLAMRLVFLTVQVDELLMKNDAIT